MNCTNHECTHTCGMRQVWVADCEDGSKFYWWMDNGQTTDDAQWHIEKVVGGCTSAKDVIPLPHTMHFVEWRYESEGLPAGTKILAGIPLYEQKQMATDKRKKK